jgi:hypothetical protein
MTSPSIIQLGILDGFDITLSNPYASSFGVTYYRANINSVYESPLDFNSLQWVLNDWWNDSSSFESRTRIVNNYSITLPTFAEFSTLTHYAAGTSPFGTDASFDSYATFGLADGPAYGLDLYPGTNYAASFYSVMQGELSAVPSETPISVVFAVREADSLKQTATIRNYYVEPNPTGSTSFAFAPTENINRLVFQDPANGTPDVIFTFVETPGASGRLDAEGWSDRNFIEFGSANSKVFNAIVTGTGNDFLRGSDARSEVFAAGGVTTTSDDQGGFIEGFNVVIGGNSPGKIDYIDYRGETFSGSWESPIYVLDPLSDQHVTSTNVSLMSPTSVDPSAPDWAPGRFLPIYANGLVLFLDSELTSMVSRYVGGGFELIDPTDANNYELNYQRDEISQVEGVLGTEGSDLIGSSRMQSTTVLAGFGGNDVIYAGTGDDVLVGGEGADRIYAGTWNSSRSEINVIEGGAGQDVMFGSTGKELYVATLSQAPVIAPPPINVIPLSTQQLEALTTSILISLSSSQVQSFTTLQIATLTTEQVSALRAVDLTSVQYSALSSVQLEALGQRVPPPPSSEQLAASNFDQIYFFDLSATKANGRNAGALGDEIVIVTSSQPSSLQVSMSGSILTVSDQDKVYQAQIFESNSSGQSSYIDPTRGIEVSYAITPFVINNAVTSIVTAPDLSVDLLEGSAYSLAMSGGYTTRIGLKISRIGVKTEKSDQREAVVGGRGADIMVLGGGAGDQAVGGMGSDLYEFAVPDTPKLPAGITYIRDMGGRVAGTNNVDAVYFEGINDFWSDITIARSSNGKDLQIGYTQWTFDNDVLSEQAKGTAVIGDQFDYRLPYYFIERLSFSYANDPREVAVLGIAKNSAGTEGYRERLTAAYDSSESFQNNHLLVGTGLGAAAKDQYNLSAVQQNGALALLYNFDQHDQLMLAKGFTYQFFAYNGDNSSTIEQSFLSAGLTVDSLPDLGQDGWIVRATSSEDENGDGIPDEYYVDANGNDRHDFGESRHDHWMLFSTGTQALSAISSTQLRLIEAAPPLPALSTLNINNLTPEEVAALPVREIKVLSAAQIYQFDPNQIAALTTLQVAALKASQVSAITIWQIAALDSNQITALTGAQIAALRTNSVEVLESSQVRAIEATDISYLTTGQIRSFASMQVASLTTNQVAVLSTAQVRAIETNDLVYMTAEQITALNAPQLAGMSTQQVSALNSFGFRYEQNQIPTYENAPSYFNRTLLPRPSQYISINEEPLWAFATPTEKSGIYLVQQVLVITRDTLQGNPFGWLGGEGIWVETSYSSSYRGRYAGIGYFYDAVSDLFIPSQGYSGIYSDYNKSQIAAIGGDISAMGTAQLAAMGSAQISALGSSSLLALTTAQVASLRTDQIQSFTSSQVVYIETRDVAAMTTQQFAALSASQVSQFTSSQILAIETRDVASLSSSVIAGLNANQISALSTGQVAALTVQQILAVGSNGGSASGTTANKSYTFAPYSAYTGANIGSPHVGQTFSIDGEVTLYSMRWITGGGVVSDRNDSLYNISIYFGGFDDPNRVLIHSRDINFSTDGQLTYDPATGAGYSYNFVTQQTNGSFTDGFKLNWGVGRYSIQFKYLGSSWVTGINFSAPADTYAFGTAYSGSSVSGYSLDTSPTAISGDLFLSLDYIADQRNGIVGREVLSGTALSMFSPSQMSAISPSSIASLGSSQLRSLGSGQIQSLTNLQIQAISTISICGLLSTQIGALRTDQVVALTTAQFSIIAGSQVAGFTTAQVSAIETQDINAMSSSAVRSLSSNQLSALDPQRYALISSDIFLMTSEPISALSSTQISSIELVTQLSTLSSNQIAYLSTSQLQSLTTSQITTLAPSQIAALTDDTSLVPAGTTLKSESTYQQMDSFQIGNLSNAEKKLIFDTYLSRFYIANSGKKYAILDNAVFQTHEKLDGLFNQGSDTYATSVILAADDARSVVLGNKQYVLPTMSELRDLYMAGTNSPWSTAGWTWGSYWTANLMENGNHGFLDQPSNSFASDFFTDYKDLITAIEIIDLGFTAQPLGIAQISAFSSSQVAAFETADIQALKSSQISALSSEQFGSLTTAQLAAIETQDFVGITSSQLGALTSTSIKSLGQAQFYGNLSSSQIEVLLTHAISGLTSAQIPALVGVTPIVLDLNGDGIQTLNVQNGVTFDIDNDGTIEKTGWVSRNNGLLVRDINRDGIINDGGELFGSGTLLADGSKASDGYMAMRMLDTNADGLLNALDQAFAELGVWRDSNGDGRTDPGELVTLGQLGIREINLNPTPGTEINNGNLIGLMGSYTTDDGKTHTMGDVWFQVDDLGGKVFDLAAIASAARSSEIDLGEVNVSRLNVSLSDVLAVGAQDVLTGHVTLTIDGELGDVAHLEGGGWSLSGTSLEGAETYMVYVNQNAEIRIHDRIQTVIG